MKKIPTLFQRDWDGDRSQVLPEINPVCQWVVDGEGVATRKLDGTSCLIRDGKLLRRRELKPGDDKPPNFEIADQDGETGKTVGWIPVGDGPEDKYHREALANGPVTSEGFLDGTYELLGPKIQGNVERMEKYGLLPHTTSFLSFPEQPPRDFESLKIWLTGKDIEGIVFHHPDGRMAKIKLRDFGLKRVKAPEVVS